MINKESTWVNHVRSGNLDEGYKIFVSSNPYFWLTSNITFRLFFAQISYLLLFILDKYKPTFNVADDAVNLDKEFLLFWKKPDMMGRLLLKKIGKYYYKNKEIPARALAWYAHWLVFQGKYKIAGLLLTIVRKSLTTDSRLYGETLSLLGNFYYFRNQLDMSAGHHQKANEILKAHNDIFFQIFNIGTAAKTFSEIGTLKEFKEFVISNYDGLSPEQADERYGMRVLIYSAYLNFMEGNIEIGKQFYYSAERCFDRSGSSLDRAAYCVYKSAILIYFRDLNGAKRTIRKARFYLNKYGHFDYYKKTISSIEGYLFKEKEPPFIINKLLTQNFIADRSKLESWYQSFFSTILPVLEFFLNEEITKIIAPLEKATNSRVVINQIKDDVKIDDIKDAKFQINDNTKNTFEVEVFHSNKKYQLNLSTEFRKWRNYEIFEAIRSTLFLLQTISKQNQLKNITFSQAQKLQESEIARRIAHDIRSPLAALQTALNYLSSDTPSYTIIKNSTQRMEDIANSLSRKRELEAIDKKDKILLKSFFETLIASKRSEYQNTPIRIDINFKGSSAAQYVFVNELELFRALSNIINNAIESYQDKTKAVVQLNIEATNSEVQISVEDNGCGIDLKYHESIFEKDFSLNKKSSGLGLFYAKKEILNFKGDIKVQSEIGQGTSIIINLPLTSPPPWVKTTLFVWDYKRFVIVDDFKQNLEMIENKLRSICPDKEIIKLSSPEQLQEYLNQNIDRASDYFVIDHDFVNSRILGTEIIISNKLQNQAVLSTYHHENEKVIQICKDNKIKIVPKLIFEQIKILTKIPNVFIIDDEEIFLKIAQIKFEKKFKLHLYQSPDEIITAPLIGDRNAMFFIDKNFKNSKISGSQVIENLKSKGYDNLYNMSADDSFYHSQALKINKFEFHDYLN